MRVFPDLEALSHAAAEAVVHAAEEAVAERPRFALVLAGGSTPRRLYELLAGPYRDRLPWAQVHVFWGDERCVPFEVPASNYGMARETLLRHVPLPEEQIHPMPVEGYPPEQAAAAYEELLHTFAATRPEGPLFDLVLLGLGADGHTASLFPEDAPHLAPKDRWVQAVTAPPRHVPRERLTLTLSALNEARDALFLVAGAEKREAVRAVYHDADAALPATHVHPQRRVRWLLDEAASALE